LFVFGTFKARDNCQSLKKTQYRHQALRRREQHGQGKGQRHLSLISRNPQFKFDNQIMPHYLFEQQTISHSNNCEASCTTTPAPASTITLPITVNAGPVSSSG
jgi:hypothetical protein